MKSRGCRKRRGGGKKAAPRHCHVMVSGGFETWGTVSEPCRICSGAATLMVNQS
jgi:hypothetical protein